MQLYGGDVIRHIHSAGAQILGQQNKIKKKLSIQNTLYLLKSHHISEVQKNKTWTAYTVNQSTIVQMLSANPQFLVQTLRWWTS